MLLWQVQSKSFSFSCRCTTDWSLPGDTVKVELNQIDCYITDIYECETVPQPPSEHVYCKLTSHDHLYCCHVITDRIISISGTLSRALTAHHVSVCENYFSRSRSLTT